MTTGAEEDEMVAAKTWTERLDEPGESEVRPVAAGRRGLRAEDAMLYPNARAVDDAIRAIPAGQTRTQKQLRPMLAQAYGADVTCPVTTRHSIHTVAEAANEAVAPGTPRAAVIPVWRVTDFSDHMKRRLSFGPDPFFAQREHEG